MKSKFIRWWIKGSAFIVVIATINIITGATTQPPIEAGPAFTGWIVTYLVLLSPIGAIGGYIGLWMFALFFDLILSALGFEKNTVRKYVTGSPKKTGASESQNFAGRKIELLDGVFGSRLGGTNLSIDSQLFVKVAGIGGKRVGKIERSGIFRDENNEIIGQIDDEGVLREYSITGGKGSGKPLGEVH